MRKTFTLFSRVMALLFAAVLAMPSWADGNPYPSDYWKAYWGYSEETPVDLEKTFPIGTTFNIMEEFPALAGKALLIDYYGYDSDIPASDNEDACVFEVSEPQYQMELGSLYSITLGRGFCVAGGDAQMTVWAFDYEFDPANDRNVFTKKYTYNITVHVSNEIQPGYEGAGEADPTAIHDIKMYVGETRVNWITFYACQASYYPAYEQEPAYLDVDCGEILDDVTHERYPTLISSDESVVHIGAASYYAELPTLEAVAPGTVTITVNSIDPGEYYTAITRTFTVTVLEGSQQHPGEGGLHFTNLNRHDPDFPLYRAYIGHDFELPTLVNETGLPNSELEFESTNTDVATIDENGVITLTGGYGETWISVEQRYYPKNHSDMFNLAVTDPFTVMGAAVDPSNYNDILNDGGSLKYIPETHTFVMEDLHVDYLNGGQLTESNYGDLQDNAYQSVPTSFINWNMPNDVNIYLIGSNEILNANRIVVTDTTICHNVNFTGHGLLYAKIYYSSFVNGVYTNAFVQSGNDYREVIAEGDTVTNITIDGASVVIDRDVTFDIHYPNIYSQIISVNKLKVINKGYIRAKFIGDEFGVKNVAKAVITLKEFEHDATTDLFYYLDWVDDYGYNYDNPQGDMYRSKSFLSYSRTAILFEAGPTIDVAESSYSYDLTWQDPTASGYIGFENSSAATYSAGAGIVMYRGYTDTEIEKGLKTIAPKTEIWNEEFPGVVSLYISRGSGTINLRSYVNAGYLLKVMIVDGDNIIKYSYPATGLEEEYEVPYCLENSAYAAIYMQPVGASPAPAQKAPQQKKDAPGLYLTGIGATPLYVGEMEPLTAKEDPDNAGIYYATFFNSTQNYYLPNDGTEAYYATIDANGDLQMTLVAGSYNVILKNHAVILKANKASIGLIPEYDTPTHTILPEATSAGNDLTGTDDAMVAPANCYVLSGHSADNSVTGVGFYQFTGTLAAHKAYAIYSGGASQAPAHRMRFIFNDEHQATGIENAQNSDIRSQKVVENGQLIIIRNGVKYNAAGQTIK
ncbi:MAG: hypothetical protein IJ920_00495 [Paludibacteraceae bacterium]|nr:hypothetical protein [Paludibacteraceae bacterium]